jgi:hypothetical protein
MSELKEMALRKIGRNIVNFQKIEGMLKLLVSHSNFKSPVSKIAETLEERKKNFKKQSFGNLTKEYFKSFAKSVEHAHEVPEDWNESWISLSFKIENEDGSLPQQKAAFSLLVSERNKLIHQMLIGFDPDSTESCNALILDLDKQNEMIQREYTNLQTLLKTFYEARKELLKEYIQEPRDLNGNG